MAGPLGRGQRAARRSGLTRPEPVRPRRPPRPPRTPSPSQEPRTSRTTGERQDARARNHLAKLLVQESSRKRATRNWPVDRPLLARPRPSPRPPAATRPEGHLPGTVTIHHTTATGHRLRSHLKPARRTAPAWTHDHAPLSPHSRSSNARCRGRVTTNCGTREHSPGHVGTAGLMTTGHARVHCACTGCGRRSSKGKRTNARRRSEIMSLLIDLAGGVIKTVSAARTASGPPDSIRPHSTSCTTGFHRCAPTSGRNERTTSPRTPALARQRSRPTRATPATGTRPMPTTDSSPTSSSGSPTFLADRYRRDLAGPGDPHDYEVPARDGRHTPARVPAPEQARVKVIGPDAGGGTLSVNRGQLGPAQADLRCK